MQLVIDTNLEQIKQGGQLLHDGIRRICHVCGTGEYSRQILKDTPNYNMRLWNSGAALHDANLGIEIWECGTCHHIQFFRSSSQL